jgi:hypothetical protein
MRKAKPKKRVILPDPVFGEVVVAKFVNHLMLDGKKNTLYAVFFLPSSIRWFTNLATITSPNTGSGRITRFFGFAFLILFVLFFVDCLNFSKFLQPLAFRLIA